MFRVLRGNFFRMRTRALDRLEQSRRCAIRGRQGDRCLGNRRGLISDHGCAATQRVHTVIENNFSFADLNASAACQRGRRLDYCAVIERAIGRT